MRNSRKWVPPAGTKVEILVASARSVMHSDFLSSGSNSHQVSVDDWEAWIRAFWKPFGLKWRAYSIRAFGLGSAKLPEILRAVRRARDDGNVKVSAWITEGPAVVRSDTWWKLYGPPSEFYLHRLPTDKHYGWYDVRPPDGARGPTVTHDTCSERFRAVVARKKLTGLNTLPVVLPPGPDRGNWHEVFATAAIGRGLDHPLLDAAKHEANLTKRGFNPMRRWGESVAWGEGNISAATLVDDLTGAPEIVRELLAMEVEHFRISGERRFAKEYLPKTDFAYMNWGWADDTGPGAAGRVIRSICCNSLARQALLEAGLLRERDFEALWVVPIAEAGEGVKILDRDVPFPLPLPLYTPAEAKVELARREKAMLTAAKASSKRVKLKVPSTLKAAMAALERAAGKAKGRWAPLSSDAESTEQLRRSRHAATLPKAWVSLLPHVPVQISAKLGPDDEREFGLVMPRWNDWLSTGDDDRTKSEKPSKRDLVIAETPFGDWYSIRITDKKATEDAMISLWDHETLTVRESWPNVRAFAGYLLLLAAHAVLSAEPEDNGRHVRRASSGQ